MLAILSLYGRVSSEPLCGDSEVVRDSAGASPGGRAAPVGGSLAHGVASSASRAGEAHVRSTSGDSAGKDDVTHAAAGVDILPTVHHYEPMRGCATTTTAASTPRWWPPNSCSGVLHVGASWCGHLAPRTSEQRPHLLAAICEAAPPVGRQFVDDPHPTPRLRVCLRVADGRLPESAVGHG